jgi:hypothetical protein
MAHTQCNLMILKRTLRPRGRLRNFLSIILHTPAKGPSQVSESPSNQHFQPNNLSTVTRHIESTYKRAKQVFTTSRMPSKLPVNYLYFHPSITWTGVPGYLMMSIMDEDKSHKAFSTLSHRVIGCAIEVHRYSLSTSRTFEEASALMK